MFKTLNGCLFFFHRRFIQTRFPEVTDATFFASCGIADLITTCYGGRWEALMLNAVRFPVTHLTLWRHLGAQQPQSIQSVRFGSGIKDDGTTRDGDAEWSEAAGHPDVQGDLRDP